MKISPREWTQLSAYLDGELSKRETDKLQARIERNPDLHSALEELREIKAILADTPRLSVPGNFTLSPDMVGAVRRGSPIRGYRLAAAALSFLFIGVVILDIGAGSMKAGMPSALAPRSEEVLLEAVSDEMDEPTLNAVEEGGEEELSSAPAQEKENLESPAPAAEIEVPAEEEAFMNGLGEGEQEEMAEAETKVFSGEEDRSADAQDEDWQVETLEHDSQPTPTAAEPSPGEILPYTDEELPREVHAPGIPWLRILEIVLGLGAVGFAAGSWVYQRKNR